MLLFQSFFFTSIVTNSKAHIIFTKVVATIWKLPREKSARGWGDPNWARSGWNSNIASCIWCFFIPIVCHVFLSFRRTLRVTWGLSNMESSQLNGTCHIHPHTATLFGAFDPLFGHWWTSILVHLFYSQGSWIAVCQLPKYWHPIYQHKLKLSASIGISSMENHVNEDCKKTTPLKFSAEFCYKSITHTLIRGEHCSGMSLRPTIFEGCLLSRLSCHESDWLIVFSDHNKFIPYWVTWFPRALITGLVKPNSEG